ncbi:MAG: zinc ribbon domain-containing protein [Blastocatellia bacterium]
MYCPKCSSPAAEGQRFCRQCGTNLGAIVDAMEGRRGPVDFERLKVDLKDLGSSLRSGFEQAHQEFKKTQHFSRRQHGKQQRRAERHAAKMAAAMEEPDGIPTVFTPPKKPKRSRESRRYHLQKGILSIFSGSAMTGVYYYLLNTAAASGLLASLERIVLQNNPDLTGLLPVVQMLWILGLIPVATGVGHLVSAMFAPSDKQLQELYAAEAAANAPPTPLPWQHAAPSFTPATETNNVTTEPKVTNEFTPEMTPDFSITEEPTLPLGQRERERQAR